MHLPGQKRHWAVFGPENLTHLMSPPPHDRVGPAGGKEQRTKSSAFWDSKNPDSIKTRISKPNEIERTPTWTALVR